MKQKTPAWHRYIMQALRATQRCLLVRVSSLPRGFVFSAVRFKPTQLTLMRLCCQWCLQDMKKHTHLLNSPVGSSEKQLKYSLIMDSALEQSGTTLKKLYIYIKRNKTRYEQKCGDESQHLPSEYSLDDSRRLFGKEERKRQSLTRRI